MLPTAAGEARPPCPRCGHPHVVRWGATRGRPRWRCRGCRWTFNPRTGTPWSACKLGDRWLALAQCLEEGLTVRQTAVRAGVHPTTAFRWRHRLLRALGHPDPAPLSGLVAMVESRVVTSTKGMRPARAQPASSQVERVLRRWWKGALVIIMRAADDRVRAAAVGRGHHLEPERVLEAWHDHLAGGCLLCLERPLPYGALCRACGIPWGMPVPARASRHLPRPDAVGGAYHAFPARQHIPRLNAFIARFRGVHERYLPNYLVWYGLMREPERLYRQARLICPA